MTSQDFARLGKHSDAPLSDFARTDASTSHEPDIRSPKANVRFPSDFSLAAEAVNVEYLEGLDPESDERDDLIGYQPGHLLVFPTLAARDAACHTKPDRPIWLQPFPSREVVGDMRQYAIGPGLGQDGFAEVAGWLMSLRFQDLRAELNDGALFDLSERIWIAGAAYTVTLKRDRSLVEVSGDRAYSCLSEDELLATGGWLLAKFEADLAAWGLTPS